MRGGAAETTSCRKDSCGAGKGAPSDTHCFASSSTTTAPPQPPHTHTPPSSTLRFKKHLHHPPTHRPHTHIHTHTKKTLPRTLRVTLAAASRSSPEPYRHQMYSAGVELRCSSTWWKACCATYATRRLGCRHTAPLVGSVSPGHGGGGYLVVCLFVCVCFSGGLDGTGAVGGSASVQVGGLGYV